MFKLLILIIFTINIVFAKRGCNCYNWNDTNICCQEQNGIFENYGKLGVCHHPSTGKQFDWQYCCAKYDGTGFDCWDDLNQNY